MITKLTMSSSSKIVKPWRTQHPSCSGCVISANKVYNIARGKVIQVGQSGNRYVVSVLFNSFECVRYANLVCTSLEEGQIVEEGELIGKCNKEFLFEYCCSSQGSSYWPVRVGDKTFFKQNPQEILDGTYEISPYVVINYQSGGDAIKLTKEELSEFNIRNRGDYVEF